MMVWACTPRKCVAQILQTKFQMRSHTLHKLMYRELQVQELRRRGGWRVHRSYGASPSAWLRVKTPEGGALLQAGRRRGASRARPADTVAQRNRKGAHQRS